MKRHFFTLVLAGLLVFAGVGPAWAGNPNPGVIPNHGSKYEELSVQWWHWAFSFGTDLPFFNTGGPVDISAHQSGNVWFLAGANNGLTSPRTGMVPTGTQLFFPLANFVNDYPCPDPTFRPDPGETLEHFLQRTGNDALDFYVGNPPELFAEIDGVPLTGLSAYRATSSLFMFKADPALATFFDPCITGRHQPGVAIGYYLLLTPLTPGKHTLHFGASRFGQDVTYVLTVKHGQGH